MTEFDLFIFDVLAAPATPDEMIAVVEAKVGAGERTTVAGGKRLRYGAQNAPVRAETADKQTTRHGWADAVARANAILEADAMTS